jgi:non-ribosomal peptide synthetase component E (peptide arylation enzyme)
MSTIALHELLEASAARFPDRIAVEESDEGCLHYAELARLSDRLRDRLTQLGVGRETAWAYASGNRATR